MCDLRSLNYGNGNLTKNHFLFSFYKSKSKLFFFFSFRFFKQWANPIIQDAFVVVYAMNVLTVFHLPLMLTIKFTVLMIITVCMLQSVLAVEKVNFLFTSRLVAPDIILQKNICKFYL